MSLLVYANIVELHQWEEGPVSRNQGGSVGGQKKGRYFFTIEVVPDNTQNINNLWTLLNQKRTGNVSLKTTMQIQESHLFKV